MRSATKRTIVLVIGMVFAAFYCEFMIHYDIIAQCKWPEIVTNRSRSILKAFILADIHMLGPKKGHWLDQWRREWQMHRSYQSILSIYKPDVVFILGDTFDEGEWSNDKQFEEYVSRFYKLFYRPEGTPLYVVAGNHDVGFHSPGFTMKEKAQKRFENQFNMPVVKLITLKNNHFVLINSMAMHGDSCSLCSDATKTVKKISDILRCAEHGNCDKVHSPVDKDYESKQIYAYSRPIIMQHFPLYRKSDSICTEPDAPPPEEKEIPFRSKKDCLSKDSTDFLVHALKPRAAFGGHTHHGCLVDHNYNSKSVTFKEYSVPSFSWRNRRDPKYMLVTFAPDTYAVNKCALPQETTIIICALIFVIAVIYIVKQKMSLVIYHTMRKDPQCERDKIRKYNKISSYF